VSTSNNDLQRGEWDHHRRSGGMELRSDEDLTTW
jgi:hypothetical protein